MMLPEHAHEAGHGSRTPPSDEAPFVQRSARLPRLTSASPPLHVYWASGKIGFRGFCTESA